MNTFKKLERLQAANTKLEYENKELKERNENLVKELKRIKSSADAAIKKADEQMKECEKLKTVYDEAIATAQLAREKYTGLYRECLKMSKQLKKYQV